MVKLLRHHRRPVPVAPAASEEIDLRVGVHDSSRIEWVASVGLPSDPSATRDYEISFTIDVPAHVYPVHNVWEHKQTFTRLKSPSEDGELRIDRDDVDELRRDTLGVAHRLKTLRHRVERLCERAAQGRDGLSAEQTDAALVEEVLSAVGVVAEMRRCLERPRSEHSGANVLPEARREWALADEFLSHQLLDFLGGAEQQVDEVLCGPGSHARAALDDRTEGLRNLIAEALAAELAHRRRRGFLNPSASSPAELARFVERASQLKKHFHDVLYLDVEAYMVDYRLRNWTGIIAAALAASFWLAFTLLPIGPGARAGISVGTFAVLFAVSYALKDRIKELARSWIAGRLVRLYGQQVVTLRLPARIDLSRRVLVEARESFDCIAVSVEDALNEVVGRRKLMRLSFRMKAAARGSAVLARAGIHSIKHVYRYDLTPIFSRLDDAVKAVPVLDEEARRVRFVEAPKEYRVPIRLVARRPGGAENALTGDLVLSKRGIERFEPSG